MRIASPPIDVGSTWLAVYETKYARVSQAKRVVDPLGGEHPLPAQRHRQRGEGHDRDGEREPGEVRVAEDLDGLLEVDLPDDVADRQPGQQRACRRP